MSARIVFLSTDRDGADSYYSDGMAHAAKSFGDAARMLHAAGFGSGETLSLRREVDGDEIDRGTIWEVYQRDAKKPLPQIHNWHRELKRMSILQQIERGLRPSSGWN